MSAVPSDLKESAPSRGRVVNPATLTKSRFKVARECPRKLAYLGDERYVDDTKVSDFMKALADGGHQVGALAKLMFPGGREITGSKAVQLAETQSIVANHSAVLFEATFQHENLLVRVDVLIKCGNEIKLIEVKSKGFDRGETFWGANGNLASEWRPYLEDVAFQYYVLSKAMPAWRITPYLMLIDPTAACGIDALATRIAVSRQGDRVQVTIDPALTSSDLDPPLLKQHDVTAEVHHILGSEFTLGTDKLGFPAYVKRVSDVLAAGEAFEPMPGTACKSCQFYCEPEARDDQHRSGWAECMTLSLGRSVDVSRGATIFGLYRDRAVERRLSAGEFLLRDLTPEVAPERRYITLSDRQALQIREARGERIGRVLRYASLHAAFESWHFPLHFIDFETARPVLPFHRGHRPNQQLLFQFSHHVLDSAGRCEHRSQCLVATPGVAPNAPVVRALKQALSADRGTVLHWWSHERSVLRDVREQLASGAESDRDELVAFIDDLLTPKDGGNARLVDFGLPLVSKLAFFSGTDGSSSIKAVLPAVLQQSEYLRGKYGQPIYATVTMPSLNFDRPKTWVQYQDERVKDPYDLLQVENGSNAIEPRGPEQASGVIRDGGAAMLAYAQLQRPDLAAGSRLEIEQQLKRYCELDSLAMVMIYEALREWATNSRSA